jgi:CBS domain-containing protein
MRARDVMVRAVVITSPDTTVEALARLMINLGISGVPVLDKDGRLVGIVTEGDLLRRVEIGTERHRPCWSERFSSNSGEAAEYVKSRAKRVADVMTREVFSVDEMATLGEIADLLEAKKIKRVPVVHDGKIVGIVSRADLLKVLVTGGARTEDEEQALSTACCSPSCGNRSGRMQVTAASSSRTGSSISGVSSDRRMSAERCASPPRTPRASGASRTTRNLRPHNR